MAESASTFQTRLAEKQAEARACRKVVAVRIIDLKTNESLDWHISQT